MLGRRVGALAGEMKRLDKKSDLSLIRYNKEPISARASFISGRAIFTAVTARFRRRTKGAYAMTEQSQILTGWKHIARYLNCGVRTVQRWEEIGCPIHRPHNRKRSPVIALSTEIDDWVRSTAIGKDELDALIPKLKVRIAELERENERLKATLERAKRGKGLLPTGQFNLPAGASRIAQPSSDGD